MTMLSALVLAGRREGRAVDPVAAHAGVSHKSLVPVAGQPMIAPVLATLASMPEVRRIGISIDADPQTVQTLQTLVPAAASRLTILRAEANLADSVATAVQRLTTPLFITTADNVLLTPATVRELVTGTRGYDAGIAFAAKQAVLDAHPSGQRRFYRFRDGEYSNCNSYYLANGAALAAAEAFRGGGQFIKHPLRIVAAFGLLNLIRFRYGLRALQPAISGLSSRFGINIRAVVVSDGAAAIDVDNLRTLQVAEAILRSRAFTAAQAA
jgi:GTP:adenosylcobinamide-phosphate guanylyltransferase